MCDFGFARCVDKSEVMTVCGTDEWMAPEGLFIFFSFFFFFFVFFFSVCFFFFFFLFFFFF